MGSSPVAVTKTDADQLKTVPVDLRKLSKIVDNAIAKKLCVTNSLQRLRYC